MHATHWQTDIYFYVTEQTDCTILLYLRAKYSLDLCQDSADSAAVWLSPTAPNSLVCFVIQPVVIYQQCKTMEDLRLQLVRPWHDGHEL